MMRATRRRSGLAVDAKDVGDPWPDESLHGREPSDGRASSPSRPISRVTTSTGSPTSIRLTGPTRPWGVSLQ